MRILLCGDTLGIRQLLAHIAKEHVVGLIAASIRPQYLGAIAELAERNSLPLFIQSKWKSSEYVGFQQQIFDIKADLIWVNSYSMIIRNDVLSAMRLGAVNVHSALLPRNRGCNPTQWSILKQENETGVTLHEIDTGLDTGPIIDQCKVPIFFEDTWLDVRYRLKQATEKVLTNNVPKILSGNWSAIPQDEQQATAGARRRPEDGRFDWSEPVIDIHNKIRALVPPLPPAYYHKRDGNRVEIREYQTPWQLVVNKFDGDVGGERTMQTDRVRLRPLQESDETLLDEWDNDRQLVIHNAPYRSLPDADVEARSDRAISKRSDLVIFVIEDIASSKVIGTCQLLNINWTHRNAKLQIRIDDGRYDSEDVRLEVAKFLTEFGFSDLNLERIYTLVFAINTCAIRTYEKCGFVLEGQSKERVLTGSEWSDVMTMGCLHANEKA